MIMLASGVFLILAALIVILAVLAAWIYGMVLCLRASLLLFLICLLVHVPFVIFALVKWLSGYDMAQEIAARF